MRRSRQQRSDQRKGEGGVRETERARLCVKTKEVLRRLNEGCVCVYVYVGERETERGRELHWPLLRSEETVVRRKASC